MTEQDSPNNATDTSTDNSTDIYQDPIVKRILKQIPAENRQTFTPDQLTALNLAFGARRWFKHPLDLRGSVKFWRWHFYYVILAGRELRILTPEERMLARMANVIVALMVVLLLLFSGFFTLYLVKSALGINILPDFSLRVWDWFK
ncbi:MAG: 3-phosphoshikimate 1-carboxyvinyltransferase [Thermodesulfobacteriota bacterium]|nr:3-phosphoshikimate 1-carboxyvinyltransferase [Thermodesulfobacteriota bacterium]